MVVFGDVKDRVEEDKGDHAVVIMSDAAWITGIGNGFKGFRGTQGKRWERNSWKTSVFFVEKIVGDSFATILYEKTTPLVGFFTLQLS